jgi:hypothetical protein
MKSQGIIRVDFVDFYAGFRKTENFFYNLLRERFDVRICDKPDFLIYSHEGDHHKLYRCKKIYFTVESFLPDFTECDYALTCHPLEDARHLRTPIYIMYGAPEKIQKRGISAEAILAGKKKFCSFIVSNRNQRKTRQRIDFFQKLNARKKVDSAGKVLNNIGEVLRGHSREKIEFLRQYKFNIAFENKMLPGYTTEKIYEAMQAHCLPIYWGNPDIAKEFNPKSFLNYFDFPSEEALIDRIIELDKDDAKYLEYMRQPYFNNDQPNEFFNRGRILDFFERIFNDTSKPISQSSSVSLGRWTLVRRNKINPPPDDPE